MEVKLGQLAEHNGSASAVKEFGARMVKDHTRLNAELSATAKSVGLKVPDAISTSDLIAQQRLCLRSDYRASDNVVGDFWLGPGG